MESVLHQDLCDMLELSPNPENVFDNHLNDPIWPPLWWLLFWAHSIKKARSKSIHLFILNPFGDLDPLWNLWDGSKIHPWQPHIQAALLSRKTEKNSNTEMVQIEVVFMIFWGKVMSVPTKSWTRTVHIA